MKTFYLKNISEQDRLELTKRPAFDSAAVAASAQEIIRAVREGGDKVLVELTKKFDGIQLGGFQVSIEEIDKAEQAVSPEFFLALETAAENIRSFHSTQLVKEPAVETMPGVRCFRESRPIEKVGLYVPGGTAILPSTLLMLAVPARLAGCKRVVVCTPPNKSGKASPEILAAAKVAGVTELYLLGGAQAIAAMAYGTESIPKVDKIFGPGNQYVTAAKMIVSSDRSGVAIDMPAGPSEVLVIADQPANPAFVAADLLAQAEHGVDSQVVLVAIGDGIAQPIQEQLQRQLELLPRRDIAAQALEKSLVIVAESVGEAIDFSNSYAPEHLILNIEKVDEVVLQIQSAGSVFLGPWTPESVGDYASGTNHTLPTYGYARGYSGVSVDSFCKKITFQKLTPTGLKNIGRTVEVLAEAEGLMAHKNAVSIRLQSL
ncbi:MAG: histidinol dehydrogenase [bacterium]|nr:histidinol dehydrogenase [bacterium]